MLWAIPKLDYYVGYGIETKVRAYTATMHWLIAAIVLLALAVRGKAKWPSIVAAAIALLLMQR